MNGRAWTEEQLAYLVQHYADSKTGDIALHLGRPLSGVYGKAYSLGLQKSESFLQSEQSGRLAKSHQGSRKTQFRKGQSAWNKGMKGLNLGGEAGQFKKGNLPANTKYDGATSIRKDKRGVPYRFVRVAKAKWVHEQLIRYQAQHGPLPKGMLLRCKDGDTLNTDPDNWEAVTRREHRDRNYNPEKAYLNGPFHNLSDNYVAAMVTMKEPHLKEEIKKHPELLELARANMKLKREIKKQSNGDERVKKNK